MVMPSVIYVADAREAMQNLRTIAAVAQKPMMVYNNPVAYRVDLKPEHMLELADCEWLAAIKESSDNIRRITDLRNTVGDRYQLFLGVDDLAYEGLALGCDGLLAGVGCTFPRETVALYDLMQAGKFAEALKIYQWMTPMLHLDVSTKAFCTTFTTNSRSAPTSGKRGRRMCSEPMPATTSISLRFCTSLVETSRCSMGVIHW